MARLRILVCVALAVLAFGTLAQAAEFPGGDSLWTTWEVEGTDTLYNIVRVDEAGDTLALKIKMTVDSDGRNVAILGPYTGLRANAYSIMGEHMDWLCAIRDTALHERLSTSEGGDGNAIVLTDSSWVIQTNEGILYHEAALRYWLVGPSTNNDTLHIDWQRDILWRKNDPYCLVRHKIKSNEADIAVAGKECRGIAVVAADGDTVQVTAACVTADSTLSTILFEPMGSGWVGAPKVLTRWDGGFTFASSGNETAAQSVWWEATRLGLEGDSLRFVWYSAPGLGYASSAHDVGYIPERGEVRRDQLFSIPGSGPFAAMFNIGNLKAAGDTIADGTSSYMDADSLFKSLGSGRSQWIGSFVAFNPNADIVPSALGFDDSTGFDTYLPYDSTWAIADTSSPLDGTNRYIMFRTDPVYLGADYQTIEYAVGTAKLLDSATPIEPVFPVVIFMGGDIYPPANTRRIWHE